MISDFLINVPVWLALIGWFVGSFARGRSVHGSGGMWKACTVTLGCLEA
tara:strand:- start:55 stop:201 length:147 start_codon:yes stop_codon:yes gene_type:complete